MERGSTRFELAVGGQVSTVLLAEDDPTFRQLISLALRLDGFAVVEASNGRELRERLAEARSPFALIISDVRMPYASGLDVVGAYRAAGTVSPLIIMTAFGDDDVHAAARRLGANAVFDKPFDLNDLRTMAMHLTAPQ